MITNETKYEGRGREENIRGPGKWPGEYKHPVIQHPVEPRRNGRAQADSCFAAQVSQLCRVIATRKEFPIGAANQI